MNKQYYSKRVGIKQGYDETGFLNAFDAIVRDLVERNYFSEAFNYSTQDIARTRFDYIKMGRVVAYELGIQDFGLDDLRTLDINQILDFVEFYFKYVSKPILRLRRGLPPRNVIAGFDKQEGKEEYTILINNLFEKNEIPLRVNKGLVVRYDGADLEDYVWDLDLSLDIPEDFEELRRLVSTARRDFFDRRENRRLEGCKSIVGACNRLLSTIDADKIKGLEAILSAVTTSQDFKNYITDIVIALKKISNKCNIRHDEADVIVLEVSDDNTLDFLFYNYFNLFRFMLKSGVLQKM